jgi:hypothetical protein
VIFGTHLGRTSENSVEKLSEKGSSNARGPDSAAIGGTKRAEKRLLGGPQGYALDASEAFRTVSLGTRVNIERHAPVLLVSLGYNVFSEVPRPDGFEARVGA